MSLLITGLIVWILIHIFPTIFADQRQRVIKRLGLPRYKGLFSLVVFLGLVLIILGWRNMTPELVFIPPSWGRHATFLLVLITFILFAAAKSKTNIKRYIRHPQLSGLIIWSIGHLLANGDSRSVILFTTLGLWALLEIILINRREGNWQKPDVIAIKNDVLTILAGVFVYIIFLFAHPWITGMKLIQ